MGAEALRMGLDEYLDGSRKWLMDTMRAHDLAFAAGRLVDAKQIVSLDHGPTVEEGPLLFHFQPGVDVSIPVTFSVGLEFMRAMYLVHDGQVPNEDEVRIPSLSTSLDRSAAVICRGGIVAQFEIWKKFVAERNYPISGRQADRHLKSDYFSGEDERAMLQEVIDLRNELTHEPRLDNDPTARDLVDYTNKLHHLAEWVSKLHSNGITARWVEEKLRTGG